MQPNVLIVDDEPAIRDMLVFSLSRAGMDCVTAADAGEALSAIKAKKPDIIVLDWMMPQVSGLELTRRLRREEQSRSIPIIMLTAKSEEQSRVAGLDSGSDDYLVKPFSPRELIARIHAILRRTAGPAADAIITMGRLALDAASHQVRCDDTLVTLGPTEFRLLQFFMSRPGRAFSRTQILDYVWGETVYIEERTVDVHIRRLRKALTPHGTNDYLQTVRGLGYRFAVPG